MLTKKTYKVLLTLYRNNCHSLYRHFIDQPPIGFEYITLDDLTDTNIFMGPNNILTKFRRNLIVNKLAQRNQIDLVYSCGGQLLWSGKKPWIVDLEHVTDFISHQFHLWRLYRMFIPFFLSQKTLKFIIPWTQAGADSVIKNLNLPPETIKKIRPIKLCSPGPSLPSNNFTDKTNNILFVSSINKNSDQEFYLKGGRILAKIIEYSLQRNLKATFIIRSKLPRQYLYLKKMTNVKVYENILSENEFSKLFLTAKLFIFPTYQSPGLAMIDALKYKLPIICSNVFSNSEMVKDGTNGYLINFPKDSSVNYLSKYKIVGVPSGIGSHEDTVPTDLVKHYFYKIERLLSNASLLEKMKGKSFEIYRKHYTLSQRNKLLKNIYEQAISNI